MYVFHLSKEYSFKKVGIKGKNFDTKALSAEAKFTIIETERGHETKIREKECIFVYFIINGKGSFEIEGRTEKCQKGDLVFIPKNTVFKYTDKMKMLLVSIPWWYPEQKETIK